MRPQNSSSSSTDSPSSLSDQNQFLQNSSLFTALPPEMQGTDAKASDQKIVSPKPGPRGCTWTSRAI